MEKIKLFVIDECRMVDEELGRDLKSFGIPILVLGDPGQLPPVSGGGFFTNHDPDVLLAELHRQAAATPSIRVHTNVRAGRRLDHGDSPAIRYTPSRAVASSWVTGAVTV